MAEKASATVFSSCFVDEFVIILIAERPSGKEWAMVLWEICGHRGGRKWQGDRRGRHRGCGRGVDIREKFLVFT